MEPMHASSTARVRPLIRHALKSSTTPSCPRSPILASHQPLVQPHPMLKFLSRHKDRYEVPYVRPSLSLQLSSDTESIASDATAPNMPGPGRTVGLLMDVAGEKVENFLNKTVGRYCLGPQAILEEIRQLHRARLEKQWSLMRRTGILVCLSPTDQEYITIEKLCRMLLKHCRSHVLAIQLEALEAVTKLAVEHPYVRQMLAGILHHSYLIPPKYREPEVYILSCKALISIKENEIYDSVLHMQSTLPRLIYGNRDANSEHVYHLFEEKAEYFLKDPDASFLFGRLLLSFHNHLLFCFAGLYCCVAKTIPHIVEWETLRHIYWYHFQNCDDTLSLAHHFPILDLFGTDHPSNQYFRNRKDGSVDFKLTVISEQADQMINLLESLCGSRRLIEQLRYLEELDEETRSLFQGTVFANEIFIAYAHFNYDYKKAAYMPNLHTELQMAVEVLLSCFRCGNVDQQTLVEEAIVGLLAFGRYVKSLVSYFGEAFYTDPFHPYDSRAHSRGEFLNNCKCKPSTLDVDAKDQLHCEAYTWLPVDGTEHPFDVTGHFPVLAGFDTSGNELYVARADFQLSYVANGARDIAMVDDFGEVRLFSKFGVMVLQHDPCDVVARSIPEDAKFQTGYVYWTRDVLEDFLKNWSWLNARNFSWAKQNPRYGRRLGEVVEADEQSNKDDDALGAIVELSSSGTTAPATSASNIAEEVETRKETEKGGDFTRKDTSTDVEALGIDPLAELRHARKLVEARRSKLEKQQKAIANQIEELEERARELELQELQATQASESREG